MLGLERPHLRKAKALLDAGDTDKLRYCCLELRLCIELICYERLEQHRRELPEEVFGKWRPTEIVDLIAECDPTAAGDKVLRLRNETTDGSPGNVFFAANIKGVSRKLLRDHYHRLGSFLHAPMPGALKEGRGLDDAAMRKAAERAIMAVEEYASNPVLSNFGVYAHFACAYCGTENVRNAKALAEGVRIRCRGNSCGAYYTAHEVDSETPEFRPMQYQWTCHACGGNQWIGAHELERGGTIECRGCKARAVIAYTIVPDGAASNQASSGPMLGTEVP